MMLHNKGAWPWARIGMILAACALWVAAFYPFISGQKRIIDDAQPYYEHVRYYLDNVSLGVYPLWDPVRDFGVDNEFYLRRIGEFNPAYLLILLLQKCGIPFINAHRIFLAAYFFLGVAAFYCLSSLLFQNTLTRFFVMFSVLFSTLGTLAFQSYLLLILVPQTWLFYFLLSFIQSPSKGALLGAVFCLMLISITYIPYYFLTVMLCALVPLVVIFGKRLFFNLAQCATFIQMHKRFTVGVGALLLIGLLPGMLWYAQSSKGEMAVVYRHSGADTAHAAALHINVVNEGGIIAPKVLDRMIFELDQIRMGDFYLPVFIFMMLVTAVFVGLNRRMIFFFCWGMLIYLIGVADASPVHQFLYQHVFFFKYFRNLQFFLWLGVLPAAILYAAQVFDGLMHMDLKSPKARYCYWAYVIAGHVGACVFFLSQDISVVITSTYPALLLSAVFFMLLPYLNDNRVVRFLPVLLLLAMAVQPIEVFGYIRQKIADGIPESLYQKDYMNFTMPQTDNIADLLKDQSPPRQLNQPFYSTKEFQNMHQNINRTVLGLYIRPRLLLYDGVAEFPEEVIDWTELSGALADLRNPAFVTPAAIKHVHLQNQTMPHRAKIITVDSPEVRVTTFIADRLVLRTDLKTTKFLVYNNVYHSKWRAFCDGKEIQVFRANHAFMGIEVPAGRHEVEFVFGDWWRQWLGMGLALIYVLTAVGLVVLFRRQRR